jgi:hypothetical protein
VASRPQVRRGSLGGCESGVVLGKEAIHHSLAAHSQWIESITKKMHKARPACLKANLQKRKLGDYKGSARGNWDAEKEDFETEWGRTAFLLG